MKILWKGHVMTMNDHQPYGEAVAIEGNKIIAVGSNQEIMKLADEQTDIINLGGRTLIPGFNDSHMHLTNYAVSLNMLHLSACQSIEELIETGRNYLECHQGHRGWLGGRGWNQDFFHDKEFPNRHDLDKISTEVPIYFVRACGHVLVTNTKALEIIGCMKEVPPIDGESIDVGHNGIPTGVFREAGLYKVFNTIEAPTVEEIKSHIKKGIQQALRYGITSIQTDDFETYSDKDYNKIIKAYKELEDEGQLHIRIYEQCLLQSYEKLEKFLSQGYKTGQGTSFFKIGPLKLLADGSLGARTAYMTEAYHDDKSTCGIPVFSQRELDKIVMRAHQAGMQIAVHCIGDGTLEMTLNSIEKALDHEDTRGNQCGRLSGLEGKSNDLEEESNQFQKRKVKRHGVVHCQITSKKQLERMSAYNMLAYAQPIFLDYDISIVEDRVGITRSKESYNFKTMLDLGMATPYSSDCPVETLDVMKGIYCAVNRQTLKGHPRDGWLPDQKVTLGQALYNYTLAGAYASFEEDIKGSIEVGKLADLVLVDRQIDKVTLDHIKDVKVIMTMVDGVIKYDKRS